MRVEDGLWYANIPFLGLEGPLGHDGCHPFLNTPWAALSCALAEWDWWRKPAKERDRILGVTPEQRARFDRENRRRWDEVLARRGYDGR